MERGLAQGVAGGHPAAEPRADALGPEPRRLGLSEAKRVGPNGPAAGVFLVWWWSYCCAFLVGMVGFPVFWVILLLWWFLCGIPIAHVVCFTCC